MQHTLRILPLAVLALILVSCMKQPDTEGFRKTVDEFNTVSMESMKSGKTDEALAYYTEDAVSMPPNMDPVNGKEAIEKWMKEMMGSGMKVTSATFTTTDIGVGGTVAYEFGLYEMTMDIPGMGELSDRGTYISVWNQQEDGSWKIRAETWNSSNPPPSMDMK